MTIGEPWPIIQDREQMFVNFGPTSEYIPVNMKKPICGFTVAVVDSEGNLRIEYRTQNPLEPEELSSPGGSANAEAGPESR